MDFKRYANPVDPLNLPLWAKEEAEILELFRYDALVETGLWGHPKADEMWGLAWSNGWEGGFAEVFFHLDDLANMTLEGRVDA